MKLANSNDRIISINDLRRRFGEVEKELPHVNRFVITKKGKPFAILSADPEIKRKRLLEMAIDKLGLSARAYTRVLKVARTIADLETEERIKSHHLSEAIQYRSLDRGKL